jgi:hypothetical protein
MALRQKISTPTRDIYLELDESFASGNIFSVVIDSTTYSETVSPTDSIVDIRDRFISDFLGNSGWKVTAVNNNTIYLEFDSELVVNCSMNQKVAIQSFLPKPFHWAIDSSSRSEPDQSEQDDGYVQNQKPNRTGLNYLLNIIGNVTNYISGLGSTLSNYVKFRESILKQRTWEFDSVVTIRIVDNNSANLGSNVSGLAGTKSISLFKYRRLIAETIDSSSNNDYYEYIIQPSVEWEVLPTFGDSLNRYVYEVDSSGNCIVPNNLKHLAKQNIIIFSTTGQDSVNYFMTPEKCDTVVGIPEVIAFRLRSAQLGTWSPTDGNIIKREYLTTTWTESFVDYGGDTPVIDL